MTLVMVSPISMASVSCTNGIHEVTTREGAKLFMAESTYAGISAHQALDKVKNIATSDGYVVVAAPNYSSPTPSLGIGKPPSPIPMLVQIQQAAGISFTAILPPGMQGDSKDVRVRLCGLVDKFDAGRPVVPGAGEPVRATAETLEESRTTIPEAKPVINTLKPSVPFDLAAAKAALEPGHSIITGQVCAGWKGNLVLGSRPVLLYPATPYLDQIIALGKKAKPGKDKVQMDPDLVIARMEAKPNTDGEFQFSQMKPGRYYLSTSIEAMIGGSVDVYAGHVSTDYGSANVYTSQNFSYGSGTQIEKFVDVKKDGDTIKVTMQPPLVFSPFQQSGLSGALEGCRSWGRKVSHSL
jgi:hypothetical protein